MPDKAGWRMALAAVLEQLGRYDEALSEYKRGKELQGEDAQPHLREARVLRWLERLDEAVLAVGRSLELESDQAAAH